MDMGPLLKPTKTRVKAVCDVCGAEQPESVLFNPYKPCQGCGATFDHIKTSLERYQDGRQPFNIDRRQQGPI
jgi:hypothetical protein